MQLGAGRLECVVMGIRYCICTGYWQPTNRKKYRKYCGGTGYWSPNLARFPRVQTALGLVSNSYLRKRWFSESCLIDHWGDISPFCHALVPRDPRLWKSSEEVLKREDISKCSTHNPHWVQWLSCGLKGFLINCALCRVHTPMLCNLNFKIMPTQTYLPKSARFFRVNPNMISVSDCDPSLPSILFFKV